MFDSTQRPKKQKTNCKKRKINQNNSGLGQNLETSIRNYWAWGKNKKRKRDQSANGDNTIEKNQ